MKNINEIKIEKIAKRITGFKSYINILTDVDTVIIIITDDSINDDVSKYAAGTPFFSLNEVRQLLKCKPPRFNFTYRSDNKNDLVLLDIEIEECMDIIYKLNESNFDKTLFRNNTPADVYKLFDYHKNKGGIVNLYIKFSIVGKKNKKTCSCYIFS